MVRALVLTSLVALSVLVAEVVGAPAAVEGAARKKSVHKRKTTSTKKHKTTTVKKPTSTKTKPSKPTKTSGGGGGNSGGVITQCTQPGTFALTFDDGVYDYENTISNNLVQNGGKGTFFINGYNYDCSYDPKYVAEVQKTFAQGHLIGSHTWNHADISKMSDAQLNQELDLVEAYTKKVLGVIPKYFRPPYGDYTAANLKVLASRGYKVVMWAYDSGDAIGNSPSSSNAMYDSIAKNHPNPGPIVLNHETIQTTATNVEPHAVKVLKAAGYQLVTVAECLGDDSPYQWVGKPSARDSTWTCNGTPAPGSN